MRVAIIGAGFTGLAAGYRLAKNGHLVSIIEKENYVGGLGAGFKHFVDNYPLSWEWDLERYYHHWFTNDHDIFKLIEELGAAERIQVLSPKTSSLYNEKVYQIDSPAALLQFAPLPFTERIRTGLILGIFKYLIHNGTFLERWKAHEVLPRLMGSQAYHILWEPLMEGKFADYYTEINLAWFWARVYKRTPKLAYYEGGFQALAELIANSISNNDGAIFTNTSIDRIEQTDSSWTIHTDKMDPQNFDSVIVTTPPPVFMRLFPHLPAEYTHQYSNLTGIGAQTLILSLEKPFFADNTYWLNIHDPSWPFLVVAEHTNFIDRAHYGGNHIVYVGNYLAKEHSLMQLSKEELINTSLPYLTRINPDFSMHQVKQSWLWRVPYAQPIVGLDHSKKIPPLTTPLSHVYLASMSQVYPWDRGTNYAVKLGEDVAQLAMAQNTR